MVGRGVGGRPGLQQLRRKSDPLKYRNGAENIAAVEAMFAANGLQQEKRKHTLLKETARARAVGLLSAAFPAVKFAKEPSPRRWNKRSHDTPHAARVLIVNPGTGGMKRPRTCPLREAHGDSFPQRTHSRGAPRADRSVRPTRTDALVKEPFDMLRCAGSASVLRQ